MAWNGDIVGKIIIFCGINQLQMILNGSCSFSIAMWAEFARHVPKLSSRVMTCFGFISFFHQFPPVVPLPIKFHRRQKTNLRPGQHGPLWQAPAPRQILNFAPSAPPWLDLSLGVAPWLDGWFHGGFTWKIPWKINHMKLDDWLWGVPLYFGKASDGYSMVGCWEHHRSRAGE